MLATVDVPAPEKPGLDLEGPRWHRALTVEEQEQGIFIGEVRALVETVENFAPEVSGHTVLPSRPRSSGSVWGSSTRSDAKERAIACGLWL